RQAAGGGPIEAEGFRVQLLDLPAAQYRQFYNVVSNATLWFLYHGLFDHARRPRFDRHWRGAWEGYRAINSRFAEAVATLAAPGWAAAFEACCDDVLGVVPPVFVSPAAVGATELEKTAASERCETELVGLEEQLAGRQVIVRVDRIELSKNLLRGFLAYDELL